MIQDDRKVLLTVIVTAYNVDRWLAGCLKSILAQTYTNLEVLVINDGSTDQTASIIDNIAKQDRRIVPIHQVNKGLVKSRDIGIAQARGAYVGFVDGDDTIEPDMYERLVTNAVKYHADISHCGYKYIYENGETEEHYGTGELLLQDRNQGLVDLLEGVRIEPSLCNKIYAKHLLKDSCLDDTVLNNEDLLRNFVLFQRAEKSIFEDFCPYLYWKRENTMSTNPDGIKTLNHVLKARKLILKASESESLQVYERAYRLWLSTYVGAYHSNMDADDLRGKKFATNAREQLIAEKENLNKLIIRQRFAAWGIIMVPKFYNSIYSVYEKVRGR